MLVDSCDRCGFLADDYSPRDLRTGPSWLTVLTDETLEGAPAGVQSDASVAGALADLRATVDAIDTESPDPADVHAGIHALRDLGRVLHEAGAGAPTQQGTVASIHISAGGVPKSAVPSADVGRRGLVGDRQADRKHHGRPFQAVCLWSSELIDALAAEGHPIRPGAAGENITVSGIDWATLRAGVRVLVGQALLELSAWSEPCRKNDQWFTGSSHRIDHKQHPGWSRIYAWVLEPGPVVVGDEVIIEP